ncbi:hypothetical protein BZA70DRAFT_54601 [Myxozyma melibiosi]|uniref:BHLH domain-containing protein n=1 Tax=Myxozyma melibiosi TaxID=54550 RepID=A0ABR1FFC7_9ASCO
MDIKSIVCPDVGGLRRMSEPIYRSSTAMSAVYTASSSSSPTSPAATTGVSALPSPQLSPRPGEYSEYTTAKPDRSASDASSSSQPVSESADDDIELPDSKAAPASPPSKHPSSNRRFAHILSEQRRRENINGGFLELKSSIPQCRGSQDSKAVILRKAVLYIASLESELASLKCSSRNGSTVSSASVNTTANTATSTNSGSNSPATSFSPQPQSQPRSFPPPPQMNEPRSPYQPQMVHGQQQQQPMQAPMLQPMQQPMPQRVTQPPQHILPNTLPQHQHQHQQQQPQQQHAHMYVHASPPPPPPPPHPSQTRPSNLAMQPSHMIPAGNAPAQPLPQPRHLPPRQLANGSPYPLQAPPHHPSAYPVMDAAPVYYYQSPIMVPHYQQPYPHQVVAQPQVAEGSR